MNRRELIENLLKDRNLSTMTKKQANQFIDGQAPAYSSVRSDHQPISENQGAIGTYRG